MPNTAKQEAIRKAYGEYWERFHTEIQEEVIQLDGWLDWLSLNDLYIGELFFKIFNDLDIDFDYDKERLRPKSLQGIENNNGWIRIESDEDLPLSGDLYLCKISTNAWDSEDYIYYLMKDFHKSVPHKLKRALEYTHYQPIVKPEKPIY